ncbi:MAG: helix-turn-helix domain-containing protein [Oscillibacter sp.]|nr:helix-turn-helix domain-containing protein [Oscillibacter sp.]
MDIPETGVLNNSLRYFFTPSSLASELLYYPTRVGRYFCDHRYAFNHDVETARLASHRLNLMLICVCRGELRFVLEGEAASALPGQIALFDCRQPHEYSAQDDTEFYWILFNGLNAETFYRRILQNKGECHVFAPAGFPEITRGIGELVSSCETGERMSEVACSQLIHRLLCELLLGGESRGREENQAVSEAIGFINRNLYRNITVGDAAAAAGFSPAHFSRVFKLHTGYSPYEYILLGRIGAAKHLLTSTRLSVKEVAYQVGYNSEENFIHSFRKKVGVTPGVFRSVPV